MTNLFWSIRSCTYACVLISSLVVLGIAANFAALFLPTLHRDFVTFTLTVPVITILILMALLLRSTPGTDVLGMFILAALWLTMGSYSEDYIGHVECFALGNQRMPTKNGTMSAQEYCREAKVIEAFSWANFCFTLVSFVVLLMLTWRLKAMGHEHAFSGSIFHVPWFGEYMPPYGHPGYEQGIQPMYPSYGYPMMQVQQPYVMQPGSTVYVAPTIV